MSAVELAFICLEFLLTGHSWFDILSDLESFKKELDAKVAEHVELRRENIGHFMLQHQGFNSDILH